MINIKKIKGSLFIYLLLLALVFLWPLIAANKALLSKKAALKERYEKIEREYWKEKERVFKEKEAYKTKLDNLEILIQSLYTKKNNRLEELYLVKDNARLSLEDYESIKEREGLFKADFLETVQKEEERIKYMYPNVVNRAVYLISSVVKAAEQNDMSLAIRRFFEYKRYLIDEGEKIALSKSRVIKDEGGESFSARKLRLGYVGYIARGEEDLSVMIRKASVSGVYYNFVSPKMSSSDANVFKSAVDKAFAKEGDDMLIDVPVDVSLAGLKAREFIEAGEFDIVKTFTEFLRKGGIVMIPLLAVALLALMIIIERIIFFTKNHQKLDIFFDKALVLFLEGKREEALSIAETFNSPVVKVVRPVLEKESIGKENAENIVEEMMVKEIPLLEKRLSTLGVLGAIAPLLGLLGTVSGMISLFEVITVFGTGNPKILAGGISEALVTTQTGLSIAIPVMFAHHFLVRTKEKILSEMERSATLVLNTFIKKEEEES